MTACAVVVMKKNMLDHSRVFLGDERGPSVSLPTEEYFKEQVREHLREAHSDYIPSDKELADAIEDGSFYDAESNLEVFITWPQVELIN